MRWVLCLLTSLSLGCEPAVAPLPAASPAPAPRNDVRSGTRLERWFPLSDQNVYSYVTENDEGQGILMAKVSRIDATHGDLAMGGGTKSFEFGPQGVSLLRYGSAPVFVLQEPLTMGHSWRGEHGGTVEVIRVNAVVEVPAGRYDDCVQTLERRGGDRPLSVATTFCPEVGIVLLEAASGAAMERAELKSYGPPVEIGPDGVQRVK